MAIQVNGTQVIGNSRELTNIASVDATTAAAIGAAGVGGSVTLTADGAITAGDPLVVTSSGEAKVLAASVIGPTYLSDGSTQSVAVAGNGSGQFVLLQLVDSVGLRATVLSDTTGVLVAGTTTTIVSSGVSTTRSCEIMYHPNSGKYVIGYCTGGDAEARVLSVSGTTPSVGSATKIVGDNGGEFTIKYAYSTSDYKVGVIVSSGYFSETTYYVSCCVGTVSGTSISFGSKSSLETSYSTCEGDIAYSPDDNKFVMLWRGPDYAKLRVGTISGTSFSLGSEFNTGESTRQEPMNLEYSTSIDRFFYNFKFNDEVNTGSFDLSGTSISGHNVSSTVIVTDQTSEAQSAAYMTVDSAGTPYTIASKRTGTTPYNWVSDFYPVSFSGTTQVGSSILQLSYLSASSGIYSRDRAFNFDSAGKTFVSMYSAPLLIEMINYTVDPLAIGNPFVGFADSTVSDGGSVSINLAGKVATNVGTGLTPGKEYFIDGGAAPTLSDAGYNPKSIGIATSSTDILMT